MQILTTDLGLFTSSSTPACCGWVVCIVDDLLSIPLCCSWLFTSWLTLLCCGPPHCVELGLFALLLGPLWHAWALHTVFLPTMLSLSSFCVVIESTISLLSPLHCCWVLLFIVSPLHCHWAYCAMAGLFTLPLGLPCCPLATHTVLVPVVVWLLVGEGMDDMHQEETRIVSKPTLPTLFE